MGIHTAGEKSVWPAWYQIVPCNVALSRTEGIFDKIFSKSCSSRDWLRFPSLLTHGTRHCRMVPSGSPQRLLSSQDQHPCVKWWEVVSLVIELQWKDGAGLVSPLLGCSNSSVPPSFPIWLLCSMCGQLTYNPILPQYIGLCIRKSLLLYCFLVIIMI